MSNIKCFTNENFAVLSYLFDIKDNNNESRISQQELGDKLGMSRVSINKIIKQLKKEEYITMDSSYMSKYTLTEKAISAVSMFRKSDNKNG